MMQLSNLPIQRKLTVVVMVTVCAALVLVAGASGVNDWFVFKRGVVSDLNTAAKIIAANSTAALSFEDQAAATVTLRSLTAEQRFTAAAIYVEDGRRFASYMRSDQEVSPIPLSAQMDGHVFHEGYVDLFDGIYLDNERIGTVYIRSDLSEMRARVVHSLGIVALVLVVSIVFALLLSTRLQRVITEPILQLEQAVRRISEEHDFTIRVTKQADDELGNLANGFNEMLSAIQSRDVELMEHREHLEEQVIARTVELAEQKERAEVTLHSIGDAVITTDDQGIVEYLNPVAEKLTGCLINEAIGRPVSAVLNIVNEVSRKPARDPVTECLRTSQIVALADNTMLISSDGEEYAIDDSAAPIRDRDGEVIGVIVVFHDVGKERKLKTQLSWQATHDVLTRLTNRSEFERRLNELLTNATADGREHALLYLDLDQFKVVNDTCGHVAGDELLKQLSTTLQKYIRETDTLARLGGDEFGVLLNDCHLEQALDVAEKLRESVKTFRFGWESNSFEIGVSIGLAPITSLCGSTSQILAEADVACYAAKDLGRNRVHVYEQDDEELALRHGEMRWVSRLQKALEEDRLKLFGQEIVHISSYPGEPSRYEILVRMVDEDGSIIPPGAFIPAAERYSLMPVIDRWVIDQVFQLCEGLFKDTAEDLVSTAMPPLFSVNLSGATLNDPHILEFLHQLFSQYHVPPSALCFEITETAAIASLAKSTLFIKELKQLGCLFALDDFGSGLSSFAYLKNLPVDYLKIDGMFVKEIVNDPTDLAMVKSINEIGHVMGITTVAEFVENEDIFEALKQIGVDYAQGYWIDKPQPIAELLPAIKAAIAPAYVKSKAG